MCRYVRSILAAVVLLLIGCENSLAVVCTPFNQIKRYVGITDSGNPNYDPLCTDNDVNSAIAYIAGQSNTCPAAIYITHEHDADHVAQHIVFDNTNRSITLVGLDHGIACGSSDPQICGSPPCPAPTAPLLTLDGYDTSGSVIHLNGQNNVALLNLTIQHGAAAYNANGGGIYFSGTGTLGLTNTVVQSNYAGYGGGIYFNGSGGNATLTLNNLTLIVGNEAQFSGGGIRVDGTARLFALQDQTILFNNKADGYDPVADQVAEGYGGGLEIVGPARADIGSGGYNGLGVIYLNKALYGGGVAVFGNGNSGDDGTLRLFTTNAKVPGRIQSNTATNTGGGVFLRPNYGAGNATFCAQDFRLDDNIAQEGTAIYADEDNSLDLYQGGHVALNLDANDFCVGTETTASLGAVSCNPGVTCSSIDANIAEDKDSQPTAGSTILIQNVGALNAYRLTMRSNQGAHVIRAFPGSYEEELSNCLLADNQVTSDLILLQAVDTYDDDLVVFNCTIANNSIIGASSVFHVQGVGDQLHLTNDIIWQPGVPSLTYDEDASFFTASYVITNSVNSLPAGTGVVSAEPMFMNPDGGDYHLQPNSPGVDYAPAVGGFDLDGLPRDIDLPSIANVYGTRDIGAYERQNIFYNCGAADSIFCTGFEHP